MRRHLHVTCALIEADGLLLATQRSQAMSLPNKWEFPGGKIELGESPERCLEREILEELNISVQISKALPVVSYPYETFDISLYPFVCSVLSGEIRLHEHAQFRWVKPTELMEFDLAPADVPVLRNFLDLYGQKK